MMLNKCNVYVCKNEIHYPICIYINVHMPQCIYKSDILSLVKWNLLSKRPRVGSLLLSAGCLTSQGRIFAFERWLPNVPGSDLRF